MKEVLKKIKQFFVKLIFYGFPLVVFSLGIYLIYDSVKGLIYDSVKGKDHTGELYFNLKTVIVKMGQEDGYSHDKFHQPTINRTLLIKNLLDTTLFAEWMTSPDKYYNYKVGDTLHFDYIIKNRFFHINKRH